MISSASIAKLFREHIPGTAPLRLSAEERKAFVDEFLRRFEGDDWIDTRDSYSRGSPAEKKWQLHSFTVKDPDQRSWYSSNRFQLLTDESGQILLHHGYYGREASAGIGSLDEIVSFILECKRRLERLAAKRKRREKVRGFKHAALIAQVKEIAREEEFDFFTKFTPARITLWIKLDEAHNVEIYFAPKRLQETLPRLPTVIRALRASYEEGVTFKIGTRHLPWGSKWIKHDAGN